MSKYRIRAFFLLTIVALIWGVAGPVIKLTLQKLPWDIFLSYRFLVSTVIILPFIRKSHFKMFKKIDNFFLILVYALSNSTLGLSLLFAGTERTSLVSMSLISLFAPVLTIFAGYYFLKDRVTWLERIGIIVTFLGSFLIIVEPVIKLNGQQGELVGNLLVIASLISGTVAAITLKELLRKGLSPVVLANLSFFVGLVTMLPLSTYFHPLSESIRTISTLPLAYHAGVWYMGVFSGTVAYTLANIAQRSIEVSEQAVFGYVYPIISTILAVLILKEGITPLSYFGGGITLVGIFIAEVKRRTRRN